MPSLEQHAKGLDERVNRLRRQVEAAESSLRDVKLELQQSELEAEAARQLDDAQYTTTIQDDEKVNTGNDLHDVQPPPVTKWPLTAAEYQRYGRQAIMPEIGLPGQIRLREAKVLVVGVGGLGCPAAAYLAGAGVGTLGLMDGDTVELSNLHRQIAHATTRIGMSKVDSAHEYLLSLNPEVHYVRHEFHLTPEQAVSTFEKYDLVLDCTDHPTSRYLISDACVLACKPLVSASALKTEGQLTVLNNPPKLAGDTSGGPCYRCIFPKPPPAESVLSCGEGGILGPVVGVMGVLQALEAIKLITTQHKTVSEDPSAVNGAGLSPKASLLMFSAYSSPQFRTVRLRSRRAECAACSSSRMITVNTLSSGSLDYVAFCGRVSPVNVLAPESRISAKDFAGLPQDGLNILIDVRDEVQHGLCALPGSTNVPWTGNASSWLAKAQQKGLLDDNEKQKYLVCRFGNDSQLAVKAILDRGDGTGNVKDIRNGFAAWRTEVDSSWPDY